MSTTRVLFVCTHNAARSQMAEAWLNLLGGNTFEAFSAGTQPTKINPFTIQVMEEVGAPMTGKRSKLLQEVLSGAYFDYVITVCANADQECPVVLTPNSKRLHWGFEDPSAALGTDSEKLARFREIRDQIKARIEAWLKTHPG